MERYPNLKGRALAFLLFLWFVWFANFAGRIIFAPILPIIEDEFMISHARASSVFFFLSVGYSFAMFVSGLFSSKFGYKISIFLCLAISSLVCFVIPLIPNVFLLFVFVLILGFSIGLYLPSAISLITEYYSETNWGKAIAIHDTGASTAIFAIPLIVLGLLHFLPWRGIFVVFACVFLVCAIVFYRTSTEVKIASPGQTMVRSIMRIPALWLISVIWLLTAGANIGVYSITPLYLTKEMQLSIDYANTILGISRLGSVGVAVACGFLIDKVNLKKFMFFVMVVAGILTVFLGLVSVRYVGAILFLQASVVTGFFPIGLVAIAKIFNREMRSLATGIIIAISMAIGGGVVPYLLGVSGDLHSFGSGIMILGILVVMASALVFRLKELD